MNTRNVLLTLGVLALAAPVRAEPGPRAASAGEEKARAYFTDSPLVNERGEQVRFYSDVLKDKVVVINFIYTRCKGACPLMTSRLKQVKQGLGDLFGRKVYFVSISLDPSFDTPEQLRSFAAAHGAQVAGWTFLTGKKQDVDVVVKRLGQYVEDPADHSTMLLAGNVAERHWIKLRPDEPPVAVAERLRELSGRR